MAAQRRAKRYDVIRGQLEMLRFRRVTDEVETFLPRRIADAATLECERILDEDALLQKYGYNHTHGRRS